MLAALLHRKGASMRMQRVTQRLFYTDIGRILVSALFGAALAIMFQRTCKGDKCVVIDAPAIKDIEPYVFQVGDKCYRYESRIVHCPAPDSSK